MNESKGLHVLLVEDNPSERWLFAEMLRSRGHMVTTCEGTEEAVEAWKESRFPLVLLDWVLPEGTGAEICRRLRDLPGGERVVILVVTGKDDPDALEEVLRSGADDYIAKPVDVGLLNVRLAVAEKNVRDMEERAKAEEGLARATAELRTLFQNLGDIFFSVDLKSDRLIQVSPAVSRLFGIPAEELESRPERWMELIPSLEREELLERIGELEEERSLVLEFQPDPKGAPERWLEASLRAERDESGEPARIDGVIADVSDRRRNQQELAARNQELLTLHRISEITLSANSVEAGYDEILGVICDATGFPMASVELATEGERDLLLVASRGFPAGLASQDLRVPLDGSVSGKAFTTGEPVVVEDVTRKRDFQHRLVRDLELRTIHSFPILVGGEPIGVLSLGHVQVLSPDPRLMRWGTSLANYLATFTERVRALEALRAEEARYRALAGELQRANRELESFAYTVSHDLRAPLRTMQGFAHTLLQNHGSEFSDEARGHVERILASGKQSELLIRDLLAYSRLSLEELELGPVSLDEVVSDALSQLEADLRDAGARVEVEPELPEVVGHLTTLVQVLSNLISNAAKFSREGEKPVVRVRAERGGDRVRLWIEDNGIGIPAAQRERIFRAFERLSQSQSRPGTGIGLAVVRRGMERVGGAAGVESTEGEGSRFWIELRASDPHPGSASQSEERG